MPGEQHETDHAALDKMLRFNDLLDAYGALLTERQRRLARKHFQEDLTFSEIAREEGVSRQAAHDAVKHAGMTLERFESHLGLAQLRRQPSKRSQEERKRWDSVAERLQDLMSRLEAQSDAVISRQWILSEIGAICDALALEASPPEGEPGSE